MLSIASIVGAACSRDKIRDKPLNKEILMDLSSLSALMGEDLAAENYADLWVVCPSLSAAPLLGEARRLADTLGCYAHAVVADETLTDQAIAYGADRVHVALDAVTFLAQCHPEFAFFPVSHTAQAAQLAQRLRAGLVTDARNVSVDDSTRALRAAHPVYGGDYFVDGAIGAPAKIVTLNPVLLPEPYADMGRSGEVVPNDVPAAEARLRDLGPVDYMPQAWRPLTKAKRIVSIGQAVKDAEGVALAQQIAAKLGAEFGGDRSARDFGWVDEEHEVGITGAEVTPDLYLALGIRGDTIHNVAIVGAKTVIAVHPSPTAPLFKAADYAIVADPKAFMKQLLEGLG
jgi:electron transfer flavoprotein alpha subunit